MSVGSPEAEGGGEEQLLPQLGELTLPTVSKQGQAFADLSFGLGLIHDDYLKEPETRLSNLIGSDIALQQQGHEDGFIRWRATHMYGGKLVVQEVLNKKIVSRWMVAGSVYTSSSIGDALNPEESSHLALSAWESRSLTGVTTKEREIPAMVAPGIVCLNAMLSLKRLKTANELRSRESIAGLLAEPRAHYALALSNGADREPSLYFLEDEPLLTAPIIGLARMVKDGYYRLLP